MIPFTNLHAFFGATSAFMMSLVLMKRFIEGELSLLQGG
jgi:hypothetical protein